MSQGNQEKIQQISEEIVRLEDQRDQGVSDESKDRINAQIKGLVDERTALEEAAEKEQREQGKQAIVGTYMDTLSQMFEALLPSDTFRQLFGINDYEEKRAQFYQLSQAYTGEAIETQHQNNEEILAAKDERIKALNAQSLSVQQQLDEAIVRERNSTNVINHWIEKYNEEEKNHLQVIDMLNITKNHLNEAQQQIEKGNAAIIENCKLRQDIVLLEEKIAAQQPKEEAKPSVKVTDLINEIKSKNDIAPDDFIARWNARQKDDSVKVEVPEVPQQELPFPNENGENPTSGSANIQLPSAEASQTAEVATFPTVNPPDVNGATYEPIQVEDSQPTSGGSSEETIVTESRLETRLALLKAEIIAEIQGEKVA